jgi:hypothetical protein
MEALEYIRQVNVSPQSLKVTKPSGSLPFRSPKANGSLRNFLKQKLFKRGLLNFAQNRALFQKISSGCPLEMAKIQQGMLKLVCLCVSVV